MYADFIGQGINQTLAWKQAGVYNFVFLLCTRKKSGVRHVARQVCIKLYQILSSPL